MISRSINLTRVVLAKNMSFTFTLNKHFQWYTCNSKRLMFQQSFFPIKISQLQLYHSSRTALTNDENDRETLKEAVRELSEGQASLLSHPPIETLRKWDSLSLSDLSVNQLEELARAYFEGTTDFPADDVRAVSVWKTAMERGSIESSYSYAVCLREGKGIEKDTTKAYQIFRKLAESHNYPLAHYSAGILLSVGEGCQQDDAAAYQHFKAAALGGVTPAIHNMGNAFANGSGVEQSDVNAVKFYEAGAEAGDPSSKFTLGVWYSKGRGGLNVDLEKAFQLQLQAAEQGHPLAMFNIGVYYMGGKMVEQDLNLAAEWFQKAASLNLAAAAVNLSTMYRTGTGVPKDLEKARNLLLPHIGDDVCRDILSLIDNEIAGQ